MAHDYGPNSGTRSINREVAKRRMRELGLSVMDLVARCAKLGSPISRRTANRCLAGCAVKRVSRESVALGLDMPLAVLEAGAPIPRNLPPLALFRSTDISSCVQRSVAYLLDTQNSDGGWGMEAQVRSDPHNTAEVIRGLQCTALRDGLQVRRALHFLVSTQDPHTGGWSSRLQFGDEHVTTTATAACTHVLAEFARGGDATDSAIQLGLRCLIDLQRGGLWPNRPRAAVSIHATALSLQTLACAHALLINCGLDPDLFSASAMSLELFQNPDGGFPLSGGESSSIAASLYVLRSLLYLSSLSLAKTHTMICRLRQFLDESEPQSSVQTEFQENDAIVGQGCQFEHFNVARLLLLARHGQLSPAWLPECSAQISSLMRPQGCRAHLHGRVYTWSTSQVLQALCCDLF